DALVSDWGADTCVRRVEVSPQAEFWTIEFPARADLLYGFTLITTTPWLGTVAEKLPVFLPRSLCSQISRTSAESDSGYPISIQFAVIFCSLAPRLSRATARLP